MSYRLTPKGPSNLIELDVGDESPSITPEVAKFPLSLSLKEKGRPCATDRPEDGICAFPKTELLLRQKNFLFPKGL